MTALILGLSALVAWAAHRQASKDWRRDVVCAAPGLAETRTEAIVLGDTPAVDRYRTLFAYFVDGFVRHLSQGAGRVQYCGIGSINTYRINGLEGFARTAPLLAAWISSGRGDRVDIEGTQSVDLVSLLRTGILGGVDRRSPDYWGDMGDADQRIVEAADIARVVWMTRETIWDRLGDEQQRMVQAWLVQATVLKTPHNNWMLFPIIIDVVLAKLQAPGVDPNLLERARRQFDAYRAHYLQDGWFEDNREGVDFYNAWSITYDLFWIHRIDAGFEASFIVQAIRDSASLTEHLIGPRGIPILGRSICYRTAIPVPILAASFLDPPNAAGGDASRALDVVWRYFLSHDSIRDGALTQGYYGTDLRFLDDYSGPGSCQWGVRSLVLALMHEPGDAFWTDPAGRLPVELADYSIDYPKLGWRVTGRVASGEITVDIADNANVQWRAVPYTRGDELRELIHRRPFRPSNWGVKYRSRTYSSLRPFPLEQQ